MLLSLSLLLFLGLAFKGLLERLRLPALLGMMLAGALLGPGALNLIAPPVLELSADLRKMALIVILLRAGLSLPVRDLRQVGRPAFLLCFLPATLEFAAVTLLAPLLFHISRLEAALLGAVLGAVSPAVTVPRMIRLMEEGYGTDQGIPQMILAGAAADDVYVIVLFTSLLGLCQGEGLGAGALLQIPLSILLGLASGALVGVVMAGLFRRLAMRDTVKLLLLFAAAFFLVALEELLPLSGLLAVMAMGAAFLWRSRTAARRMADRCSKIWVGAELLLFALVGAAVDIRYVAAAGGAALLLLAGSLLLRMAGVYLCCLGTPLRGRERLFTGIAYLPKATVQAAIGGIPLAMGLPAGEIILTVAAVSIVVTAPLGALGIDWTYRRLLSPSRSRPPPDRA